MLRHLLSAVFLLLAIPVTAQNREKFEIPNQPYFLVDSFRTDMKLLFISTDKIESVSVLKDSGAIAMYGEKARSGAVIVKTKPNTKLLRLAEILDKFQIAPANRNLRVCINKTLIGSPELILAEASEILGVEITNERHWVNPGEADGKERYINIKTKEAK